MCSRKPSASTTTRQRKTVRKQTTMHHTTYKFVIQCCLSLACCVCTTESHASTEGTADALLDHVIAQFPKTHIRAQGTMFVRQRRGVPRETYRFSLDAKWHPNQTQVTYIIRDKDGTPIESLRFQPDEKNIFSFETGPELEPAPLPDLAANIAQTDLSWLDLSLYFLWWRGARFAGQDSVRGLDCHIVEVEAPPSAPEGAYAKVRLWISSEQGLLLQAEGFDKEQKPIRKLWVQSVKQVEDQWIIQTLEVQQHGRNQRTRLHIADVETDQDQAL